MRNKSEQGLGNVVGIDIQSEYFTGKLDKRIGKCPKLIETVLENIKTKISECCYLLSKEFSK